MTKKQIFHRTETDLSYISALNTFFLVYKDSTREGAAKIHVAYWPDSRVLSVRCRDAANSPYYTEWSRRHPIEGKNVKTLEGSSLDDHATFVVYWIEEGWDGKFYAKSQIFMYAHSDFMPIQKNVHLNELEEGITSGTTNTKFDITDDEINSTSSTSPLPVEELIDLNGSNDSTDSTVVLLVVMVIAVFMIVLAAILCGLVIFFVKKKRQSNKVGSESAEKSHGSESKSSQQYSEKQVRKLR